MENVILSVEVLNKVMNYLAGRPYAEVAQLINEVSDSVAAANAPAQGQEMPNMGPDYSPEPPVEELVEGLTDNSEENEN